MSGCMLDKCNKGCTISAGVNPDCNPYWPATNSLGFSCSTPTTVPKLDQIKLWAEEGQIVDPFALIETCGSIPTFDFTCQDDLHKEVRRYMFDGRFEDNVVAGNDTVSQYEYYLNFTSWPAMGSYSSAFTAAENVQKICVDDCEARAMVWKEKKYPDYWFNIVEDAALGATCVILDRTNAVTVGWEITIVACSPDECMTHPFTSEVTSVDPVTWEVCFCDPLPWAVIAVQTSEDGCEGCESKAYYNHGATGCGVDLPTTWTLEGASYEHKYTYFEEYGEIIEFSEDDIRQCVQCAQEFGGDDTLGVMDWAMYAMKTKLGDFRERLDRKMLMRYFFASWPKCSKEGHPMTWPWLITHMLQSEAEGCCVAYDFCALNDCQKAAKIIDIMDKLECCKMNDNPEMRMIMNTHAITKWKKLTREWNRLLGEPVCCTPQDWVKNFNRLAKVQGYLMDRAYDPEESKFLDMFYRDQWVILFVPRGYTIMRTFNRSVHNLDSNMNIVNGSDINLFRVVPLMEDQVSRQITCTKAWKIHGSFLLVNNAPCEKMAFISWF